MSHSIPHPIYSKETKVLWKGKFLDGILTLGLHPHFPHIILFEIEDTSSEFFDSAMCGKVDIPQDISIHNVGEIVDHVVTQLTKEYLEVQMEVRDELISDGVTTLQ